MSNLLPAAVPTVVVGRVNGERREAVAELLADAVGSAAAADRLLDGSVAVLAFESGGLVAAGCVSESAGRGLLTAIAVAPVARGRGLGRAVVEAAMTELGLHELAAETDAGSVGFYRSCGFTIASLGEKYPGVERFRVTRVQQVRLRPFAVDDEGAVRAAHTRLAADGVDFCLGLDGVASWAAWLEQAEQLRGGITPHPRWVPETSLGAFVGPTLVGRVSVRHRLNEELAVVGGHIGYVVLPEHRRRGYAGVMMQEALRVAHEVGIERVLVTCSDDNTASVRVIERAGGVLEDVVPHPTTGERKRRYWIDLDLTGAGRPGTSRPSPRGTRGR